MDAVRWDDQPRTGPAVLIAAFEGWNDAGDGASVAARYLAASWNARRFGSIDPEEFYDFTSTRPQVRLRDGITREVVWPEGELWLATPPDAPRPVVFLHAAEPQLRWRTYTEMLVDVARKLEVELAVTLGALLADVPHTHPVRVTGTAADPDLVARLGLQHSRYEGPTGIVGVLHDAAVRGGFSSVSLWAAVPHYLPAGPNPKASLALVEKLAAATSIQVETDTLARAAAAWEEQVTGTIQENDELRTYVERLEAGAGERPGPTDLPSGETLAAELEQFLRDQRREGQ